MNARRLLFRALSPWLLMGLAACGGGGATVASGTSPSAPADCQAGQVALDGGCADTAATAESVRGIVRAAMTELDLRSAIVGVSIGDTPVLGEAFGESEAGQPATLDMHWRIGSIGIAYLTTALLQLQDQGLLSIDDKLSKWLPDYPHASDITLAMLANSTSGYAEYVDLNVLPLYADVHRQWTEDELLQAAFAQPMACQPGTCFFYSHANFIVLGRVMEKASGKPLADLIRIGILEPLGMGTTRSDPTSFIPAPVLHAFSTDLGSYQDSTDWNPSWTTAAGAIMTSTVPDVMRSAAAIATGRLLSPQSYAQLLGSGTRTLAPWTPVRYYGLGVFVTNGWVLQNPYFFGYSGVMAYLPSQKIAIVVTATLGPGASFDGNISQKLFQRIAQSLAPANVP